MEQVTDAWSAGISDYLIKPCKQADLARTLSHWEHVVHTGAEHKPMSDKMREDHNVLVNAPGRKQIICHPNFSGSIGEALECSSLESPELH
jgi:response regulator of citrate/malate metabolism